MDPAGLEDLRFETQEEFIIKLNKTDKKNNYYSIAINIIERKDDTLQIIFQYVFNKLKSAEDLENLLLLSIKYGLDNIASIMLTKVKISSENIPKAFQYAIKYEDNVELFSLLKKYVSELNNIRNAELYDQLLIDITNMNNTTYISQVFEFLVENAFLYLTFKSFIDEYETNRNTIDEKLLKRMVNYLKQGASPNLLNIFEILCKLEIPIHTVNGKYVKVIDIDLYLQTFIDYGADINSFESGYPLSTLQLLMRNGLKEDIIMKYLNDLIEEYKGLIEDGNIIELIDFSSMKQILIYLLNSISYIVKEKKINLYDIDQGVADLIQ